jgi:hypothetical protein
MIQRFRKIAKDLYRGSAPTPVDVVTLKHKLGINKIVSLDQLSGDLIDPVTKSLGIVHIMIPITFTKSSLINLFSYDFKKLFLEGGPTFIHCAAGKDRTGLVSAIIKCKFFGEDPQRALMEAKSLGFGIGVDPKIVKLYEKLIMHCKSNKDSNSADIVSNEREYIDDNRGSILESGPQGSFAPYLDQTKSSPNDFVYHSDLEQSPTRDNIKAITEHNNEEDVVPIVGLYNNDTAGRGFGPTENAGGFFYD